MFTGLVETVGLLKSLEKRGEAALLTINATFPATDLAIGDSVAVNGACLTVTSIRDSALTFDVSPESLSGTTLGILQNGQRVNLERAMKLGDRMGGHIVTGHIDCVGKLSRTGVNSGNHILEFSLPTGHVRYLVTKGSVTIDGISLTVNTVSQESFTVNIIPHTYTRTTLSSLRVGDKVNIETDIIGKYVERLTAPWKPDGGLSMKTLAENGFI